MTVEVQVEVGEKAEERIAWIRETAHKGVWIGLGAFAMVGDGVQSLYDRVLSFSDKAVERGQSLEQDSRDFVSEQREDARKNIDKAVKDGEKRFDRVTKDALATMHLPSKRDVDSLNRKLNQLNRKLKELEKAQANGHK